MNDDCVYLIFEQLDFGDLLNVTQISGRFSTLAADVFRRNQYWHVKLVIRDVFPSPDNPNELVNVVGIEIDIDTKEQVNEDRPRIELQNGDQILNAFKHIGPLIKKFKSNSVFEIAKWHSEFISKSFGKLISEYSSESLVDVEINIRTEKLLEQITNPLINVENVTFRLNTISLDHHTMRFNEIFPAVRRLNLLSVRNISYDYLDCHMPYLDHVSIERRSYENLIESFSFPGLIVKNPQIRSIDLQGVEHDFIKKMNSLLPKLETLALDICQPWRESIQFENVTTLFLAFATPTVNLHFPRLQNLYTDGLSNPDGFAEFLNEHNNLSHLLLKYYLMSDSEFQSITANRPNLVEITLEQKRESRVISSAHIVEFLRNHANVKRFNLFDFLENQKVELQEQLKDGWNIRTNGGGLSLERKANNQL